MVQAGIIVRDGLESHRLLISHRDFSLLGGPHFAEGSLFIQEFGIYDNFTVARGVPKGSTVIRPTRKLLNACRILLMAVERDASLLQYDYSYSFSKQSGRNSGAQGGVLIRGAPAYISTRPHGYCYAELKRLADDNSYRVAEWIDLRVAGSIETDSLGTLKVHRRKAEIHWLERLPPLIEFLRNIKSTEVEVEHLDRVE